MHWSSSRTRGSQSAPGRQCVWTPAKASSSREQRYETLRQAARMHVRKCHHNLLMNSVSKNTSVSLSDSLSPTLPPSLPLSNLLMNLERKKTQQNLVPVGGRRRREGRSATTKIKYGIALASCVRGTRGVQRREWQHKKINSLSHMSRACTRTHPPTHTHAHTHTHTQHQKVSSVKYSDAWRIHDAARFDSVRAGGRATPCGYG